MKRRLIARGAAFCACAMLMSGIAAAEEKRLGDLIYVPQMTVSSQSGMIALRVEGLALESGSDEPVARESLAGAEFGVYVISGDGELTPWANPLYPSEPMRIRTGEGETRFTLPQGAEYYLRQESAPQGYAFDEEALIPVAGEEIVVHNAMAGELLICAVDSLGTPLSGVEIMASDAEGNVHSLITDENGEAVLRSDLAQRIVFDERALPEGVFAARAVSGAQAVEGGYEAQVSPAARTRVTFEHPASGSVLLDMKLEVIDDNAQTQQLPLEGVRLDILSDPVVSVVTDAQGQAHASLLEGTYGVRLSYEGDRDAILPIQEGQMIVSSGSTTVIELSAVQPTGRIVIMAEGTENMQGGSVTLWCGQEGDVYGPYPLDAEGVAVSDPLAAGVYHVKELVLPQGAEFGGLSAGGAVSDDPAALEMTVAAGQVTQAELTLLTRRQQTFALLAGEVDEQGENVFNQIDETLVLTLIDEAGDEAGQVQAIGGEVNIDALSGRYTLAMGGKDAQRLGVTAVSDAFELPGAEDTVVFPSARGRLLLSSVDENGMAAPGAVYIVTDSAGSRYEVACDEDGMAVTPLLEPGYVTIETDVAPKGHDAAEAVAAEASAGRAEAVRLEHQRYGSVELSVRMQRLDEQGETVSEALAGASVMLYRLSQDGQQMTDTGIVLETDENGMASVQLERGEYVAQVDAESIDAGCRVPQAMRFSAQNMQTVSGELTCMGALGGVRVRLIGGELHDQELAQVRFVLIDQNGTETEMAVHGGALYAGGLAAGNYVLRQTQMPAGYTLSAERTVAISGGEALEVSVPLEEYAVLSVTKTGLTFDDAFRTYIVPLSGQYGVYTMEDGEMKPYPSADAQATVWANVTAEQNAAGMSGSVKLPASVEGTTYYLHEMGAAKGFEADEAYHEIMLRAGETQTASCAVSSDRGFFTLEQVDAASGEHLPGGVYELVDARSGEIALAFEVGDMPYQNPMAIPVGEYLLRQKAAAAGYVMNSPEETAIAVEPYLTQGGTVASVRMEAARIPQQAELAVLTDIYAANEQGLTLVCVDTAALGAGESLLAPQIVVRVGADGGERTNIASVALAGAGDAQGGRYMARVEYCLSGGGWQPSDARTTGVLEGPTAVSLADIKDDVSAVRVTFLDADTGEETVHSGFMPGQIALSVQASGSGEVQMHAEAAVSGVYAYRTSAESSFVCMTRSQTMTHAFTMQTVGLFETVSAGRDGRISGAVFFDEDADGVMDGSETGRYAGMTVSLLTAAGDVVDSMRTDAEGRYAFETISSGEYVVQFDAGEKVVFSVGDTYSAHRISGVLDTRYGTSSVMAVDGDHSDYVVNAGCIFASEISGAVLELVGAQETVGFGGLSVEMRRIGGADEEPLATMTDDLGVFRFSRVLPGEYEMTIALPQGYLCQGAQDGALKETIHLAAGAAEVLDHRIIQQAAALSGAVRIDDDGDGMIDDGASGLEGVKVVLLDVAGGSAQPVRETTTRADGAYVFDALYAGTYSVLFELDGQWAFTRYGKDSLVYGAVSQSGSTKSFDVQPGETMTDVNAGVTIPAQMAVSVFRDTQLDGRKGVYEEMLEGASISLIRLENGEDAEEITYKTDAEGNVNFAGVSPGEYVLAYQMPGQWRSTRQVDPAGSDYPVSCVPQSTSSSGRSEPFTLSMGQSGVRMYIGAMLSGSISGTVYYDDNADAKLGENEGYCVGAKVELLAAADGSFLQETTAAEDGSYAFEGLAPGRYRVQFTVPEGCGFSATERTMTRSGVQQSVSNVSSTRAITVSSGSATETADAGVVRLGSLSGVIFEDSDADTAMSENESAMAGVTVNLMDGAGRIIITSTETDAQGGFTFANLRPGSYKLRVDAPEGYVFSGAMAGSALPLESERAGRGYSQMFSLLGGAHVRNIGYGLLTQGVISGLVWEDKDYDGLMEDGEAGLRGVTVALTDAQGNTIASTQTIRSGEFAFEKLMPGHYALSVTLGEGFAFTADGGDSRAPYGAGGSTQVDIGVLDMGGSIENVRFGALKTASVSGIVWFDQDDDGKRQSGDAGVAGVRAVLTMLSGRNAGLTYEAITGETGEYRFDGVMPGTAQLSFELMEGSAFGKSLPGERRVSVVPKTDALHAQSAAFDLAAGESRIDQDAGVVHVGKVSGRIWEDSAYNGRADGDERGVAGAAVELIGVSGSTVSSAVTDENGEYEIDFVRVGEYTVKVTLPDGMIFTRSGEGTIADVDGECASTAAFSLAMGESRSGLDVGAITKASMSGRIVIDENEDGLCGDLEAGFDGAVVTAMQGGTVVATVKTDDRGGYAFDALRPGAYRLRFSLGGDAMFAPGVSLRMTDPDAIEGETGEYELTMGRQQAVEPVPVVLASSISGRAWLDQDVSGTMDAQESAMTDVKAVLLDGNGGVLDSVQVDADGRYAFTRLRSGSYALRFTLGSDVLFTEYTGAADGSCVPVVPGGEGQTGVFALNMGEQKADMNVGGILPGEIGDTVWLDENGNGLQDYREPLIPGVKLTLLRVHADGTMTEAAVTESDRYGYYSFESLRPGMYVIRVEKEEGDILTFSFGAPLGEIDSDVDPETGVTAPFALQSGQALRSIDVGLTERAQ